MHFSPLASLGPETSKNRNSPTRLALLGATGSIGTQVLDLVAAHPDKFVVTAVTVNNSVERAIDICRKFDCKMLVIANSMHAEAVRRRVAEALPKVDVRWGTDALSDAVVRDDVDMVVTATVGYSGFLPTLAAIEAGKDIALANKETLVVGGEYIRKCMQRSTSRIFPVDSEHSAIAQCLCGEDMDNVSRLILTASGGPFRTWTSERLKKATRNDALKHPNWDMGAKITIDSATMMNKAFEIIEAHYLFGTSSDRIEAIVHPQSIIHSMVEFNDGAIKAQLGLPDMHIPIAYALGLNRRIAGASEPLKPTNYASLTFEEPDISRFPCLGLASLALERKGNTACIINAANEVAVDAFLHDKISFTDIYRVIEKTLERVEYIASPGPDEFIATNDISRRIAFEALGTN